MPTIDCTEVRMEFLREAMQNCVLDIQRAREEVEEQCAGRRYNVVRCGESRVKLALFRGELRLIQGEQALCQHGG